MRFKTTYDILRANADVLATFGTRIFPVVVPMGQTLPALVVTVNSHAQTETSQDPGAYDSKQVRIGVLSTNYTDCETYRDYVYTALQNYQGTIDSTDIKTITCDNKQTDEIVEQYWKAEASSGQFAFMINMDFTIYFG